MCLKLDCSEDAAEILPGCDGAQSKYFTFDYTQDWGFLDLPYLRLRLRLCPHLRFPVCPLVHSCCVRVCT